MVGLSRFHRLRGRRYPKLGGASIGVNVPMMTYR
jgi:hypothetical protein